MSENFYENALSYVLTELENSYKNQGKESEFIFNFNMNYVEETMDSLTVSVNSSFLNMRMQQKGVFEIVESKIKEITGQNVTLNVIIKNSDSTSVISSSSPVSENKNIEEEEKEIKPVVVEEKKPFKKHPQLKPEFNFDSFVPGDNCRYAYNASISIAKDPGKDKNPVLIYGGSGLGKTHLMQAIGNYIYQENPDFKIAYLSAESFTNEFLESLKTKKTTDFKNKYRNLDLLLLDDIHFLKGKDQTQEELFYTFNALADKKTQMIFTCDRPIKEIRDMALRLVSRLSQGLTIDIQTPKYEERYAILLKKIELLGKSLNPEIIDYIAKNIETNVRDLEGALTTVINYEELSGKKLNLEQAQNLLRDIISDSDENVTIDSIEQVICNNFGITPAELKSKKRDTKYVIPRNYFIYIARTLTEITYIELGSELKKDHSTVMHSYNKIDQEIKNDSILKSKIDTLIREIKKNKA